MAILVSGGELADKAAGKVNTGFRKGK